MKLPKNPWPIAGHLRRCWLFSYRTPQEAVRSLLPAGLEAVTLDGCAFWNIVVCEVTQLRPVPLPAALGLAYWHVGYRLPVRARASGGNGGNGGNGANSGGKIVEGVYFLRSDADRPIVTVPGNWLTDFHFHTARVTVLEANGKVSGRIDGAGGGDAQFQLDPGAQPGLAAGSPFANLTDAEAFLKYEPYGISVDGAGEIKVVRVVRSEAEWRCRPIVVDAARWQFLENRPVELELCLEVSPIDYRWARGERLEVAP